MKFKDLKAAQLDDNEIILRLFGEMELENSRGYIDEKKAKPQSLTWPTLKYLLANSNRDVSREELLAIEYPGKNAAAEGGALRTRLRRVRDILAPLGLESIHGLVLFNGGKCRINPDYRFISDEDAFNMLIRAAAKMPPESREGLELCTDALELCRGVYLGYTRDAPWLRPYQEHYRREFSLLASDMLRRMRAVDDDSAAPLLWRRAIAVAPEAESLHREIVHFLIERRLELEMLRYASQLSQKGINWLNDDES